MDLPSNVCARCGRTLDQNGLCPSCTLVDPSNDPAASAAISASGEYVVKDGVVVAADADPDRDRTAIDAYTPEVLGPVATPAGSGDDVSVGGPIREEFEVFRHMSVHQAVARVKELAPVLVPPNKRPALIITATAVARQLLTELQNRDAWSGAIHLRREPGEQEVAVTCTINGEFVETRTTGAGN